MVVKTCGVINCLSSACSASAFSHPCAFIFSYEICSKFIGEETLESLFKPGGQRCKGQSSISRRRDSGKSEQVSSFPCTKDRQCQYLE